jgi:hypothetical protein
MFGNQHLQIQLINISKQMYHVIFQISKSDLVPGSFEPGTDRFLKGGNINLFKNI